MNFTRLLLALGISSGMLTAQAPNPLTITPTLPGQFQLSWLADNLRPYQMESSPDLLDWAEFGPIVVGSGTTQGMLVTATAPKFFYRMREGAMRPGFEDIALSAGDDHSYPIPVSLGPVSDPVHQFEINFYNSSFSTCYINNNGNITFDNPLSAYTPEPFAYLNRKIISPFWADVDTRGVFSNVVRFSDNSTTVKILDGHRAFGVTYRDVGYYNQQSDKLNAFQVIIIERSDVAPGDFDIELNYNNIRWETGSAPSSGGENGFGGLPARVGLANGIGNFLEYKGSGETLAFLDKILQTGMPNEENGLIYQTYNNPCPGRIIIPFRNGFPTIALKVNAGSDQLLEVDSGSNFQLHGSVEPASMDPAILWEKLYGPGEVLFSDQTLLNPVVTISEPGNYVFKITASKTGDFFVSDSDEVSIEHPATFDVYGGYNSSADASETLIIPLNQAVADFTGSSSVAVEWTQVSGEDAVISDTHVVNPIVTLPGEGYYTFQIKASTNQTPPFVKYATAEIYYFEEF